LTGAIRWPLDAGGALTLSRVRANNHKSPAGCADEAIAPIHRRSRPVGMSQRKREINQRRHRRKKLTKFEQKLAKATVSERKVMAQKLRALTPGAERIITNWGLEERP
jgi:hypothetical protein